MRYSHTKTEHFNVDAVLIDAFTFDESWRRIRGKRKNKLSDCHVCKKAFKDRDKISLLIMKKGNKVGCHECSSKLKKGG